MKSRRKRRLQAWFKARLRPATKGMKVKRRPEIRLRGARLVNLSFAIEPNEVPRMTMTYESASTTATMRWWGNRGQGWKLLR